MGPHGIRSAGGEANDTTQIWISEAEPNEDEPLIK
jgi:hypothetical protein